MGRTVGEARPQHTPRFCVGLGRLELERRAVIFVGDFRRQAGRQVVGDSGGAAFEKIASGPPHNASSPLIFSGPSAACSDRVAVVSARLNYNNESWESVLESGGTRQTGYLAHRRPAG